MAYNNYSSYSTSTLDAKDKHSEAELRKMDEAELKRQLKLAIDGNDDAYFNLVNQILAEKIKNKANSINDFQSAEGATQTMKSKYEAIQNMPDTTPAEKDAKNKAIKDFFENEMKNWTSKADNIVDFAKSQKGEADRLKNLLEGAITKNVKLKESLPFGKRGRLKKNLPSSAKNQRKIPRRSRRACSFSPNVTYGQKLHRLASRMEEEHKSRGKAKKVFNRYWWESGSYQRKNKARSKRWCCRNLSKGTSLSSHRRG